MKSKKYSTLTKKDNIKILLTKGKSLVNNLYIFRFITAKDEFKYALSVNKKIFRTAVIRNKIKRQIKTFIQKIQKPPIINLLIIVKKSYNPNQYKENLNLFNILFKKI